MKPEDFKPPFKWDERRILLEKQVLYVPESLERYDDYTFPSWSSPEVFGNDHPVCIEFCSGNGAWIASRASSEKQKNWVAVEMKFDRLRKIEAKRHNLRLTNLFSVCGEAHRVTSLYFPADSVEEIYINFPDPWPKRRHADNRLVKKAFLEEVWRILKPQKAITVVTDDAPYSEWIIKEFGHLKNQFTSTFPFPYFSTEWPSYGSSYFEELWRQEGKTIRYHSFKKVIG